MATKQETFDLVVTHLRKQGAKSVGVLNGETDCLYRGPDGLMCAAGCLIPDNEYKPELEGFCIEEIEELWDRLGHNKEVLKRLQGIHDCYEVHEWEMCFETMAEDYGFDFTRNL